MASIKSGQDRYGTVAVALHWLSAFLIMISLVTGFQASETLAVATKVDLLRLHVPLGAAIFALTVFRIIWWRCFDKKPQPVDGTKGMQNRLAMGVHSILYLVIFLLAVSGMAMIAQSGAGPLLLDGATALLPDFKDYLPRRPHGVGVRLLLVLLIIHIGAACYHHWMKRDGLLRRMWWS